MLASTKAATRLGDLKGLRVSFDGIAAWIGIVFALVAFKYLRMETLNQLFATSFLLALSVVLLINTIAKNVRIQKTNLKR